MGLRLLSLLVVWGCAPCLLAQAHVLYDGFDGESLDGTRWVLSTPLDQWSAVQPDGGHLTVYGNGKWRGVVSTQVLVPPAGDADGSLAVIFRIRPAVHYPPSGVPPQIYDSRVGLIELGPDGEQGEGYYGFWITWPQFSDNGKYRVRLGGDWMPTDQPFTTSTAQHDFLRLVLERQGGQEHCRAEVSRDGDRWTQVAASDRLPDRPLRIDLASCWGALAVDAVEVLAAGAATIQDAPRRDTPQAPGELQATPFLYATRADATTRPRLDGVLDDPVWQTTESAALSVRLWTTAPLTQQTSARVCYDDENLYVAVRCHEARMDLLRALHRDASGPVWQDDCVEVFVQPDLGGRWHYYFHAVVNPLGVGWDDYGLQSRWQCAAGRWEGGWSVEMAIPFSVIGAPAPQTGDCWGVNVTREERPHAETLSWAPVRGGFHEPDRFGRLVFGRPAVRLRNLSLHADGEGASALTAFVEADGTMPQGTRLVAALPDGRSVEAAVSASGPARMALPADLPAGPLRLNVRLQPGNGLPIHTVFRGVHSGTGPLASALWPTEVYDNTLYVADGQLTHLWMLASCTRSDAGGYEAILDLPAWLEMLDPPSRTDHSNCPQVQSVLRTRISRDGIQMKRVVVQVASSPPATTIDKVELWQEPILVWLKATAPRGAKLPLQGRMYTRLRKGEMLETERATQVVLLPGQRGTQPAQIPIYIWTHGPTVPRNGWRELLAHYRGLGVNGLQEGVADRTFDQLARQYRIGTMRSFWWYWWAPRHAAEHPEDIAINAQGRPQIEGSLAAICPEVLLAENSAAFEEAWHNNIGSDPGTPVGWNYDLEGPSPWRVCFCPRCLKAFREFARVDAAVELSFDALRADPELSARWVDFAAWQTERLVRRFAERLAKERPSSGFFVNGGGPSPAHPIEGRFHWRAILPHIAGGMFFRYCNSPLASRTTLHAESEAWLREVGGIGKPLWAVLSAGWMRLDAYVYHEPDLIGLQVLQHLGIGYRGIEFWSYRGFDGRFNNALATATRLVARFEPWLLEGQRVELPPDAVRGPDSVLAVARRHGDRTAVFVLNFDPLRSATIRLSASIPGGRRLQLAGATKEGTSWKGGRAVVPPMGAAVLLGD